MLELAPLGEVVEDRSQDSYVGAIPLAYDQVDLLELWARPATRIGRELNKGRRAAGNAQVRNGNAFAHIALLWSQREAVHHRDRLEAAPGFLDDGVTTSPGSQERFEGLAERVSLVATFEDEEAVTHGDAKNDWGRGGERWG